jgi:hypothetical protein
MDVRAFGSVYGQTANLPYASGRLIPASGSTTTFAACRGFYVLDGGSTNNLQVTFADGPNQTVTMTRIAPNTLYPFSITTISGGGTTVQSVLLLY